jgi:hypothetical protein
MLRPLPPDERIRLRELLTVKRGMTSFLEAGRALLELCERRLHRETHEDFDSFCRVLGGLGALIAT